MEQLIDYTIHLADNALILGHQNSEWCGHGPVLEQDIAITNISLDLIGQARYLYQYAAELINKSNTKQTTTEDTLAYLRDSSDFKNCLLVEQPNGDWAATILRQFLFSNYQQLLNKQLLNCNDAQLCAIAEKSLKEISYHLRWSSEWVIRLGDGTEESHERIVNAIDQLWPYTDELFVSHSYESAILINAAPLNVNLLKKQWKETVDEVFTEATLGYPGNVSMQTGGKEGKHSEHFNDILAELQVMQRTYPDSNW